MLEVSFIVVILVLLAAAVTDIKKREVPDWLSYSFIALALAIALSKAIIAENPIFILKSLAGLAVFFIIANLLYYGKMFAGGDAKLLMGIGAALGIDFAFLINVLIIGGIYGLIYTIILGSMNFKAMRKEVIKIKINFIVFIAIALFAIAVGIILKSSLFYYIAALAVLSPLLLTFTKAVENSALIRLVPPEKLTEGDWLFKDVNIKGKIIKATFEGLSKSDIQLIKKSKKPVIIKYGLPFVPVFLVAFMAELIAGNLMLRILGM
jgi:Flp pilus assembly protein protease CpaA